MDNGIKFVDDKFPALDSIWGIKWKRASELVENPQFIVDGASRDDINQGSLGNCWFLAAAASMARRPEIFRFVCPPDQEFGFEAGIFKFRFWR